MSLLRWEPEASWRGGIREFRARGRASRMWPPISVPCPASASGFPFRSLHVGNENVSCRCSSHPCPTATGRRRCQGRRSRRAQRGTLTPLQPVAPSLDSACGWSLTPVADERHTNRQRGSLLPSGRGWTMRGPCRIGSRRRTGVWHWRLRSGRRPWAARGSLHGFRTGSHAPPFRGNGARTGFGAAPPRDDVLTPPGCARCRAL